MIEVVLYQMVSMILGESSSGKSSLINLILGEELLPSYLLCTTCTICELRHDTRRRIIAYYKQKCPNTGAEQKEIILSDPKAGKSYMDQISPFMDMKDNRHRGSPFRKVVLYWPHELLEVNLQSSEVNI